MKKNKMTKSTEPDSSAINILDSGTIIQGDLQSAGKLRIDGKVIGTITAKDKMILGQNGIVEGEVNCKSAEISGRVKGTLVVKELLTLNASANIEGDVYTRKLAIEPGAIFNASCRMTDTPESTAGKKSPTYETEKKPQEASKRQQAGQPA